MAQYNYNPGTYVPDMSFIATAGQQVAQGIQSAGSEIAKYKGNQEALNQIRNGTVAVAEEDLIKLGVPRGEAQQAVNQYILPVTRREIDNPDLAQARLTRGYQALITKYTAQRDLAKTETISAVQSPVGLQGPIQPPTTQQGVYEAARSLDPLITPTDVASRQPYMPKTQNELDMLNLAREDKQSMLDLRRAQEDWYNRRPTTGASTLSPNTAASIAAAAERQQQAQIFEKGKLEYNALAKNLAEKEQERALLLKEGGGETYIREESGDANAINTLNSLNKEIAQLKEDMKYSSLLMSPPGTTTKYAGSSSTAESATTTISDEKKVEIGLQQLDAKLEDLARQNLQIKIPGRGFVDPLSLTHDEKIAYVQDAIAREAAKAKGLPTAPGFATGGFAANKPTPQKKEVEEYIEEEPAEAPKKKKTGRKKTFDSEDDARLAGYGAGDRVRLKGVGIVELE